MRSEFRNKGPRLNFLGFWYNLRVIVRIVLTIPKVNKILHIWSGFSTSTEENSHCKRLLYRDDNLCNTGTWGYLTGSSLSNLGFGWNECVFCSGSPLGRFARIEIQYSKANQSNTRFWASYPFPNVKSIPNNFHRDVDYENDLIWICPCSWAFLFLGFSCFLEQHKRKETPSLLCIILPNKFKAEI